MNSAEETNEPEPLVSYTTPRSSLRERRTTSPALTTQQPTRPMRRTRAQPVRVVALTKALRTAQPMMLTPQGRGGERERERRRPGA